jgi:hypothetical protein
MEVWDREDSSVQDVDWTIFASSTESKRTKIAGCRSLVLGRNIKVTGWQ